MMVKKPGPLASSDTAGLAFELGGGVESAALPESSRSAVGVCAEAESAGLASAPAPSRAGAAFAPSTSAAGIAADAPTTRSTAAAMPYGADSLDTS
jgi:hypothetical protein